MSGLDITDFALNYIRFKGGNRVRGFTESRISSALAPNYNTDTLVKLGSKVGLSNKEVSAATKNITGSIGRFMIRLILLMFLMFVIFVGLGGVPILTTDPASTTIPTYTPGSRYASISPKDFR